MTSLKIFVFVVLCIVCSSVVMTDLDRLSVHGVPIHHAPTHTKNTEWITPSFIESINVVNPQQAQGQGQGQAQGNANPGQAAGSTESDDDPIYILPLAPVGMARSSETAAMGAPSQVAPNTVGQQGVPVAATGFLQMQESLASPSPLQQMYSFQPQNCRNCEFF
jgi:hypothetical protein